MWHTGVVTSEIKPVIWLCDSLRTLKSFPAIVQDEVGYALFLAQRGDKHLAAKPLSGFGSGVQSRVLRAPRGSGVRSARVSEEVQARNRDAADGRRAHQATAEAGGCYLRGSGIEAMAKKDYVVGSGNGFEYLAHRRPAEALAKAELARKIAALIAKRGLTQAAAAEVLQVDQPKVSALVRGRLAGFSLDRLVRFLVSLGSDVEIIVKPHVRATGRARIMVA
jgi:predicted XRE-type DNA-binding protein